MKTIILLLCLILLTGCVSEGKAISYKCARECSGEEKDIPAVLNEYYKYCYELYYYGGRESVEKQIKDCENAFK